MPYSSVAQTVAPFSTFNQSRIIQVHGLPAIGYAGVLSADRSRYRLITNIANNYAANQLGNE